MLPTYKVRPPHCRLTLVKLIRFTFAYVIVPVEECLTLYFMFFFLVNTLTYLTLFGFRFTSLLLVQSIQIQICNFRNRLIKKIEIESY